MPNEIAYVRILNAVRGVDGGVGVSLMSTLYTRVNIESRCWLDIDGRYGSQWRRRYVFLVTGARRGGKGRIWGRGRWVCREYKLILSHWIVHVGGGEIISRAWMSLGLSLCIDGWKKSASLIIGSIDGKGGVANDVKPLYRNWLIQN